LILNERRVPARRALPVCAFEEPPAQILRNIESNGERNRLFFILKSRGMAHSNQQAAALAEAQQRLQQDERERRDLAASHRRELATARQGD
jgi:hypothetical protein